MLQCSSVVVMVVLTVACQISQAGNWPQFRGPNGDAILYESVPTEWDAGTNIRWKKNLAGEGWSAPVVWQDRVFLTGAVMTSEPTGPPPPPQRLPDGRRRRRNNLGTAEFRWEVQCLDANSGDVIWKQITRQGKPPQGRHLQNSYATETPVTDGSFVYAYFGMNGLYCFDMDGNSVWDKDLGNFKMRYDWGTASSPILFDGVVYLQIDSQEQSFVVALDAATGDEVWRKDRDEPSQYSSPIVWRNSVRTEVVTSGRSARSYDPKTGKLLWEMFLEGGRSSASPLASGDRLFIGSEARNRGGDDDGGGYLFAVRAGANGKVTAESDDVIWSLPKSGLQMASPVLCEGHLYVFERRRGVVHCINAQTGEMVYETRVSGARAFWSSPWVHTDKVYCIDDDGVTYVIQGGPEFKVVRKNSLDEQVWSTPAFAHGNLFVRTTKALYCIGPKY
jgi:outer membrane protein assembly factor BamB